MKSIFHLLCLLILTVPTYGQAWSKKEEKKNAISIDAFRALIGDEDVYRWMLSYERVFNSNFSGLMAFENGQYNYGSLSANQQTIEKYTVSGNMLLLEARLYPFAEGKIAPRGFFLGTYFKHYWLEEENLARPERTFSEKHNLRAFGIDMGYKVGGSWFMFEPIIGVGTLSDSDLGTDHRIDARYRTYEPGTYSLRFGLNMGVVF